MPYANINEAFTTYTESFNGSSAGKSTLESIKNPFHIETTDPGDDFEKIASNYVSDGYNITYSGKNEWDILDEEIRGLTAPENQAIAQSPDRVVRAAGVSGITQNRRIGDRLWDRETSAQVDDAKRARDAALRVANPEGVRMIAAPQARETTGGSTPLSTTIRTDVGAGQTLTPAKSDTAKFVAGAPVSGGVGDMADCSDQTCLQLLNHILGCENCAKKFKKLMNVGSGGGNLLGIDLPEINLSKLMFWVIVIILIVAVYELLNTLMNRLRRG